ncbi:hypothetical protein QQX13_12185 [Demequina sp. SYSU T00068]|uniref:hypothetical protein n=1 Tax=Demequina lignilytica TaxID=3051663 RepID=UPI002632B17B|nr:hypothetical protein [Demequina sp. SYSU T00068]MDN4491593.1 hypothetical protein [Demequina sp. SYSU T00068]
MAERDSNVVRRIREAQARILAGTPEHIEVGVTSVRGLAKEAGVNLNWLNRQYEQERDAFTEAVRAAAGADLTAREVELTSRIEELEAEVKRLKAQSKERLGRADNWKAAAEHFIREVHVVKLQLAREAGRTEAAFKARNAAKADRDAAVEAMKQAYDELHAYEAEQLPRRSWTPRVVGPEDRA